MRRVFLDANVVLDYLLQREPWFSEAQPLWDAVLSERLEAMIGANTPLNIAYIARKTLDRAALQAMLHDLFEVVIIVAVSENILRAGLSSPLSDYEDAVGEACALAGGAEAIITRDPKYFRDARLPSYAPAGFIARHLTTEQSG